MFGQPHGDYFYWATTSGFDGRAGQLRRVRRTGKDVETLWEGTGVDSLVFDRGTAYLTDHHALFAIPLDGGKPRELISQIFRIRF